jgi:UDP-2,3-diacylglucosamine pyrophosphatase LpxH
MSHAAGLHHRGRSERDFRAIFISDVHLGSHGCQAGDLLEFLQAHRAETLYLVGDIIDMESLAQEVYWPTAHNEVLRTLLRIAGQGTRVIYIPGNHDATFRAYCGVRIGNVAIRRDAVHTDATGARHLVIHGDEFDGIIACSAWLDSVGRAAYRMLLRLNTVLNRMRMRLGYGYWPFATILKHRSKAARQYIGRFREAAARTAAGCRFRGVICGHIHRPEIAAESGVEYRNTGDWVEHCSALVEHHDGCFELLARPGLPVDAGTGVVPAQGMPRAAWGPRSLAIGRSRSRFGQTRGRNLAGIRGQLNQRFAFGQNGRPDAGADRVNCPRVAGGPHAGRTMAPRRRGSAPARSGARQLFHFFEHPGAHPGTARRTAQAGRREERGGRRRRLRRRLRDGRAP